MADHLFGDGLVNACFHLRRAGSEQQSPRWLNGGGHKDSVTQPPFALGTLSAKIHFAKCSKCSLPKATGIQVDAEEWQLTEIQTGLAGLDSGRLVGADATGRGRAFSEHWPNG